MSVSDHEAEDRQQSVRQGVQGLLAADRLWKVRLVSSPLHVAVRRRVTGDDNAIPSNRSLYSRETMETMLNEQHFLRSPLLENGNLTLEERAMFAARFQLSLRAAAAEVAAGAAPYHALGPMYGLYGASSSQNPLWSQWACLGPTLLAQQQLAAANPALLRPLYPRLATSRFAPYTVPQHTKPSPGSSPSPDSGREDAGSPRGHSPAQPSPSSPFASASPSSPWNVIDIREK